MRNKKFLLSLLTSFCLVYSLVSSAFVVKQIRVEGIQRIRESTVLNYLTIKPGDNFKQNQTGRVISDLYRTGFFDKIELLRRGNDLVVKLVERPIIGELTISGNKIVKTEDLMKSLKQNGLSQGMVYDRFKVVGIKHAMEQQYFRLGRYNAKVKVATKSQQRNRVAIDIKIDEGDLARVKRIRIIGQHDFKESELLERFALTRQRIWTVLTKKDQYSREKLDKDLVALRSFYLNRGYLHFSVDSVQVEITPNKQDVFVVVNIHEGAVYQLNGFKVKGKLLHQENELLKTIRLKTNCTFSRTDIMAANKAIMTFYENKGYSHVEVNLIPTLDEHKHTVFVVFEVNPKKPTYVNRIVFEGNSRTREDVLRRAMLQFESAILSKTKLEESKRRLSNLGYLEHVEYDIMPRPGHPDQVNVTYHVSEASTASAQAQVGYSDAVGVLYGAGLKQPNFLGTGNSMDLTFEKNDAYRNIGLSYFNPYWTISGIGRGFNVFSSKTTPSKVGISSYSTDSYGAGMSFSVPFSLHDHVSWSLGYKHMKLNVNRDRVSKEILAFIGDNGDEFDQFNMVTGWTHSTLDRSIFPTRGFHQHISLQVGLPIMHNSLDYYKLTHTSSWYIPCYKPLILHTRTRLGYGNGYGRTSGLPFFQNYHAGGIDTVRGLRDNSLGPRDSKGKAIGGSVMAAGSVSLIFPNFVSDHVRTSLFVDAGNVFNNRLDLSDIHFTAGLQIEWISPFGPLQFSFAHPLNKVSGQETKVFQFTIGTSL